MRIYVDVDGVLADFASEYLHILSKQTGRSYALCDVNNWDFSACVSSPSEDAAVWREVDRSPGMVLMLQELDGALQGVQALRDAGHRVIALTSPRANRFWASERIKWLEYRGFFHKDIVLSCDKSLLKGDVLIDDGKHNLIAWSKSNPVGLPILLDQPWNRDADLPNATVAYNWGDVLRILEVT